MMLRTTPALVSVCLGTAVECLPHLQTHLSWGPSVPVNTHSFLRNALTTCRVLMAFIKNKSRG